MNSLSDCLLKVYSVLSKHVVINEQLYSLYNYNI